MFYCFVELARLLTQRTHHAVENVFHEFAGQHQNRLLGQVRWQYTLVDFLMLGSYDCISLFAMVPAA